MEYEPRKGCYGVIFYENKSKVGIVNIKGRYFLPGGGIEGKESDNDCLKREVLEELGFDVRIGDFIGEAQQYYYSQYYKGYYRNIGHFYACQLGEKVMEPIEEDHVYEMVDIEIAMEKLVHEHQSWAVWRALGKD
ncbi:NUDIX domain-containing protein [Bacillus sp. FJAT-49736]|nr:NUDIX domain-containing protein [Bacillus sp. FJAT-49736]